MAQDTASPVLHLIEKCRQKQEVYLIEKNREPVQLSLFKLEVKDENGSD